MAIVSHPHGVSHIRALIRAGKVDADSAWSFNADDGDALLGKSGDDWTAYGQVHLGIDNDADKHTKARYMYPVAKGGKVYVSGLRAAITRAAQQGEDAIEQTAQKLLNEAKGSGEHAGFEDWVEVFQGGKHTDSSGQSHTWTRDDLDQIIANHNAAEPAPLVIGHPQTDSPAWGWTSALKRVGGKLLAKFNQVPQAVVDAVREGRYRNRSVKLAHTADGWKLIHVGLLGAAPPAVEGLAAIAFEAEPAGVTYQFDALDAAGMNLIARGMQKLRELIIAHFGQDEADRYVPQADIDNLSSVADAQAASVDDDADDQPQAAAAFAAQAEEDRKMDEKLKADLDAATARATEAEKKLAEFAARDRTAAAKAKVDALVAAGKLLPAQAAGLAEFIASEPEAATFEFSAGTEKLNRPRNEFLFALLDSLPKQIELNRRTEGGDVVDRGDAAAIEKAAKEYQKAEHAKGIEVPWHEAVNHVTKRAS